MRHTENVVQNDFITFYEIAICTDCLLCCQADNLNSFLFKSSRTSFGIMRGKSAAAHQRRLPGPLFRHRIINYTK
jgi:hypothetical protein